MKQEKWYEKDSYFKKDGPKKKWWIGKPKQQIFCNLKLEKDPK